MLTVNGPFDWHSGQEPTLTSEYEFWKKGPRTVPHLLQSYFTCWSWGKTPERLVTTPPMRIIVFKCICLRIISNIKVTWEIKERKKKKGTVKEDKGRLVTLYFVSDRIQVSWWFVHRSLDGCSYTSHAGQKQLSVPLLPWLPGQVVGHQPTKWQCWGGHR